MFWFSEIYKPIPITHGCVPKMGDARVTMWIERYEFPESFRTDDLIVEKKYTIIHIIVKYLWHLHNIAVKCDISIIFSEYYKPAKKISHKYFQKDI